MSADTLYYGISTYKLQHFGNIVGCMMISILLRPDLDVGIPFRVVSWSVAMCMRMD